MSNDPRDDGRLVELAAQGETVALEMLYERYGGKVFSLARYMLHDAARAEEVTQDVFTTLWQKASSYSAQRGQVTTWIMAITHNRVIDEIRRIRRAPVLADTSDDGSWPAKEPVDTVEVVREVERSLLREEVQAALDHLPTEQREVIVLAFYRGLSHSEISDKLSVPLGTVKTRMRLGMQKLRGILGPERATL